MKNKLKNNSKYFAFCIIFGGLLLVAGIVMKFSHWAEHAPIFSGCGAGLLTYGLLAFLQKNSHKYKAVDDERNVTVREKSGYIAFNITFFALIILEIICIICDFETAMIFVLIALAVQMISLLAALCFINRKM